MTTLGLGGGGICPVRSPTLYCVTISGMASWVAYFVVDSSRDLKIPKQFPCVIFLSKEFPSYTAC